MKTKLVSVAEVQIGYQALKRIDPDPQGTHAIIQVKDINNKQELDTSDLYPFIPEREPERYQVDKGDVLFMSRGRNNLAYPVRWGLRNTLAASTFFILRLRSESVLPEYLAWAINQPPMQAKLKERTHATTTVPLIPKADFEALKIDVPPLELQRKIVALNDLLVKERELTDRLLEKRAHLIQAVSLGAVGRK